MISQLTNFNKHVINTLMRTAILRLHDKRFYVSDILHKLESTYSVSLSRGRFDDLFMTRPTRDIVAPLDLFEQVIAVMFAYDDTVLTTSELVQLLNAMRVPLDQLQRFTKYGNPQEWYSAIHTHVLQSLHTNTLLFGREEFITNIMQTLTTHPYMILTGVRGIGKTSIVHELMRQYRTRTINCYYVEGSSITSIATLFSTFAHAVGVKSLGQEPVELRLGIVLQHYAHLVVIENFVTSALFPITTIITQFQQKFPHVKLVITGQPMSHGSVTPNGLVQYEVPPLTHDTIDSPAAKLFQHIFYARHTSVIAPAQLQYICQHTAGNPLQISLYANTLIIQYSNGTQQDIAQKFYTSLTSQESQLLTLLLSLPTAINNTFMAYVTSHIFALTQVTYNQLLQELIQRKIIIQLTNTNQYTIHDELRQLLQDIVTPSQITIMVEQVAQVMMRDTIVWDNDPKDEQFRFAAPEYTQLLQFIDALIMRAAITTATALLVTWHKLVIRYGLASEAILLLERITITRLPADLIPYYHLSIGTLYAERGMFDLALLHLTDARNTTLPHHAPALLAQITIQYTAVSLNYLAHDDRVFFEQLTNALHSHIADHQAPESMYILAGIYNQLAHLSFHMGNFIESLDFFRQAIVLLRDVNSTIVLSETLNNRALTLMMIGHISIARDTINDVIDQYTHYAMPLRTAQAQLRLALIAHYMNDIDTAQQALHDAIIPIIQFGNLKDILYFLDLHIGLLIHRKFYRDGIIIYQLSTRFRAERNVSRGDIFEHALATPLSIAHTELQQQPVANGLILHDQLDFYGTLVALRDKFHYAQPQANR